METILVDLNFRDHEGYFREKEWGRHRLQDFTQDFGLNLDEKFCTTDRIGRFMRISLREVFQKAGKKNPQEINLETRDGFVLNFLVNEEKSFKLRNVRKV